VLEVDGVKASTASDPLDVLPAACTFIVVMCKTETENNRTGYLRLKTKSNLKKSEPTQPYSMHILSLQYKNFTTTDQYVVYMMCYAL